MISSNTQLDPRREEAIREVAQAIFPNELPRHQLVKFWHPAGNAASIPLPCETRAFVGQNVHVRSSNVVFDVPRKLPTFDVANSSTFAIQLAQLDRTRDFEEAVGRWVRLTGHPAIECVWGPGVSRTLQPRTVELLAKMTVLVEQHLEPALRPMRHRDLLSIEVPSEPVPRWTETGFRLKFHGDPLRAAVLQDVLEEAILVRVLSTYRAGHVRRFGVSALPDKTDFTRVHAPSFVTHFQLLAPNNGGTGRDDFGINLVPISPDTPDGLKRTNGWFLDNYPHATERWTDRWAGHIHSTPQPKPTQNLNLFRRGVEVSFGTPKKLDLRTYEPPTQS